MHHPSTVDELVSLGWEMNANQYRLVLLAARYDDELDWFHQGFKSPAAAIASRLQIHTSTAREWIRVGHSLRDLPLIDAAFRSNQISYAKVRILTRWAEPHIEEQLLALAESRTAGRLTTAIARLLASEDETDDERDQRLHETRSCTSYTDGDGMVVIRIVLPPAMAKPIVAAVDDLVVRIAQTPVDDQCAEVEEPNASADASSRRSVTEPHASTPECGQNVSADAPSQRPSPLPATLRDLQTRWLPCTGSGHAIPTLSQQRADAFSALFLGLDVNLVTEVLIHVRGDGITFDDGTPITSSAVCRQLDTSFIRLLVHDTQRRPINASSRRRHPTTRQKRVVMEAHNHECVDCSTTELIEFDHNPPYQQTRRTITDELEPRCGPCHRARHRAERDWIPVS